MSDSASPPRYLSRQDAAAYVGVSARTFDAEVAAGMWPRPLARGAKGGALTWDRKLLDHAADRLGGITPTETPIAGGIDPEEQAALEAASRGTISKNRPQHRHAKAA